MCRGEFECAKIASNCHWMNVMRTRQRVCEINKLGAKNLSASCAVRHHYALDIFAADVAVDYANTFVISYEA